MKFLFDLFPILLFFIAYKFGGIYVATAVSIAASALQVAFLLLRRKKVDMMMWVSLGIILVLGGATLVSHDENFIKWKPTALYWIFASALLLSPIFFKKNIIRSMLAEKIVLPETTWRKLNLSWVAFFIAMGVVNRYVALNYSTSVWVNFKLFGATAMMFTFIVAQSLVLNKFLITKNMTSWYAIISDDITDSLSRRADARSAHLARLTELQEAGRLLLAGPFPAIDSVDPGQAGFSGSLVVAEFDSLDAAQIWADNDPYVHAGVYAQVRVKPFRKVLPL